MIIFLSEDKTTHDPKINKPPGIKLKTIIMTDCTFILIYSLIKKKLSVKKKQQINFDIIKNKCYNYYNVNKINRYSVLCSNKGVLNV